MTFPFFDRHHALKSNVARDTGSYKNQQKSSMKYQCGPFFFFVELVPEDVTKKIDDKQSHNDFKPPSIINQYFGCWGSVIVFNKSGNSHGSGISYEEQSHGFGAKQQLENFFHNFYQLTTSIFPQQSF